MGSLALKKNKTPTSKYGKLRVIEGPLKGHSFRLINNIVSIGRVQGESDIALNDPYCSRRHAFIIKEEDSNEYFIQKITQSNKLYLNKKEIDKKRKIKNKDIISIGQTKLKFEIVQGSHLDKIPPPSRNLPMNNNSHLRIPAQNIESPKKLNHLIST